MKLPQICLSLNDGEAISIGENRQEEPTMDNKYKYFSVSVIFALLSVVSYAFSSEIVIVSSKPTKPYRVWYQPGTFLKHPDWYKNANLFACGSIDPLLAYSKGKISLIWQYGINFPWANIRKSKYWSDGCKFKSLIKRYENGISFLCAGRALDEWCSPKFKQAEDWACEGLRKGKKENPDVFIAVWAPGISDKLAKLAKDGIVDLIILENYTFVPARFGKGPYTIGWKDALERCERAKKLGILNKTIVCLGHITDEPNLDGKHITVKDINRMVRVIKNRYPQMPGIAFYQGHSRETKEAEKLIRFCDKISGQLWRDKK